MNHSEINNDEMTENKAYIDNNTNVDNTGSDEINSDEIKGGESNIAQLELQIEELSDKLLRSMAESENIRRRYEKQIAEMRDYSITNFAKDLMSVIDNLRRGIEFQTKEESEELKNVLNAVTMTYNELTKIFEKHGIMSIEPKEGDKFDYNLHLAISQVESDKYEKDSIVSLMQTGYKIKDRLLRPAAVSVAKPQE